MVLVSLMDPQDNTSGPLLLLLMKWALSLHRTALALTGIKQVQPLDLQLSWGMTTSVIQDLVVPLMDKHSTVMTLCGMVLVVGL